MSNVVTIDSKTAKELVTSIRELKEEVTSLKKILVTLGYGNKNWWNIEIKQGEKDIKAGNYKTFKSAKNLISDFQKSS